MIGFRNNRPLLKLGDCLITEYGEQWLADALEHAARRAGTTLPFKDDLLASVRYYLEHECDLSVMQVSELYERLRRMLTEVGLAHLARELKEETPPMTVSVAEIARSVPFWLFFACELKKQARHYQILFYREKGMRDGAPGQEAVGPFLPDPAGRPGFPPFPL
mgnify:CR=1 FL=1